MIVDLGKKRVRFFVDGEFEALENLNDNFILLPWEKMVFFAEMKNDET